MAFSRDHGASCDGYTWNLHEKLGKGSYGDVYKGRSNQNGRPVAVKVVNKGMFRQDPKAEQNLHREIRIQKQLNSEYVVKLYHVQEMTRINSIVMVMELCECDLDHLLKVRPFKDNDITILLHQLGEGMKALRAQNIVHRDLKPGNILIRFHPKTGKMQIKLADFGFARIFTDEAMKPLDLTSLAGTPVFMAPEALRCVFNPGVEHYDDKVDLWSIGALLYKVMVGQCGFYAQLNHILPILSKKKDAIAWEPSNAPAYGGVPSVKYIYELPSEVDDRLSPPFKQKMNTLLCSLLKLDVFERMTFPEFFDFTDDLIKSKVEVVNLLHGTSFKFMMEQGMTTEQLVGDVQAATGSPVADQILFCCQSDLYIAANSSLDEGQFNLFMNRAGGSQGHAVLYFVPIDDVRNQQIDPHYDPLAKLYYLVQSKAECVKLIRDHKYAEEVAHSLSTLHKQIDRQFSCIQEFHSFCSKQLNEITDFSELKQRVTMVEAKTEQAINWLKYDHDALSKSSDPALSSLVMEYQSKIQQIESQQQSMISTWKAIEMQFKECINDIDRISPVDFDVEDLLENTKTLQKGAKQLPGKRKEFIFQSCEELFSLCKGVIVSATDRAHKLLGKLYGVVSVVWGMEDRAASVKKTVDRLEVLMNRTIPQWRSGTMTAIMAQMQSTTPQPSHKAARPAPVEDTQGVKELCHELSSFCMEADKMTNSEDPSSSSIYPALENSGGFLVIEPGKLDKLVPRARDCMRSLQDQLQTVGPGLVKIKLTHFNKYALGDYVLFHPVMVNRSPSVIWNNLLHLEKPKPYVFLHPDCYKSFHIRHGKFGDLCIARITRLPEQHTFNEQPKIAQELHIRELHTPFYYIWAENIQPNFPYIRPASTTSPTAHTPPAHTPTTPTSPMGAGQQWAHPSGPRRFH